MCRIDVGDANARLRRPWSVPLESSRCRACHARSCLGLSIGLGEYLGARPRRYSILCHRIPHSGQYRCNRLASLAVSVRPGCRSRRARARLIAFQGIRYAHPSRSLPVRVPGCSRCVAQFTARPARARGPGQVAPRFARPGDSARHRIRMAGYEPATTQPNSAQCSGATAARVAVAPELTDSGPYDTLFLRKCRRI